MSEFKQGIFNILKIVRNKQFSIGFNLYLGHHPIAMSRL